MVGFKCSACVDMMDGCLTTITSTCNTCVCVYASTTHLPVPGQIMGKTRGTLDLDPESVEVRASPHVRLVELGVHP